MGNGFRADFMLVRQLISLQHSEATVWSHAVSRSMAEVHGGSIIVRAVLGW